MSRHVSIITEVVATGCGPISPDVIDEWCSPLNYNAHHSLLPALRMLVYYCLGYTWFETRRQGMGISATYLHKFEEMASPGRLLL